MCAHIVEHWKLYSREPQGIDRLNATIESELPLRRYALKPTRTLWQSTAGVKRPEAALDSSSGQAVLAKSVESMELAPITEGQVSGVLLDFGIEIQGTLEIVTAAMPQKSSPRRVRVRLGESAAEAMAELGEVGGASNDHAIRDSVVELAWLGKTVLGPSGFRFARIDNLDTRHAVQIQEIRAVAEMRDAPYIGAFECSDDRLNDIWKVGAYTVHLNMQEYLWDGIKRDRLVWVGDMHPEVSTINSVFGYNSVVPASLDLMREVTPPNTWMNGISSYSMWWILIHRDWYRYQGDREYLSEQIEYMLPLLEQLCACVDDEGRERLNGFRFIDWPTQGDEAAVHEGLQAMLAMCLQAGEELMREFQQFEMEKRCRESLDRLANYRPELSGRKSPSALAVLAGIRDPELTAREVLLRNGPEDLSTFYGYYVLEALARADEIDAAMDLIRRYWGGMIDLGATTFWEDFDISWLENASRIDELPKEGKVDVHGTYGSHTFKGYRQSLCHGWASGPTAWLSRHVLGIYPLEPGFAKVAIDPELGDLQWVEGSFPTPFGLIRVRHERDAEGIVHTQVLEAPIDMAIVMGESLRGR